jgi:hypothetical protein
MVSIKIHKLCPCHGTLFEIVCGINGLEGLKTFAEGAMRVDSTVERMCPAIGVFSFISA